MADFDYRAPAELFAAQRRSGLRYRRFPNAAQAIQYAVEKLPVTVLSATSINRIASPIVGFIFDGKGLMYNLTLEGSKISRITR